ncbi:hypothetical protein Dip518_001263 [Parelusimicrobium proximum]|uniref:hypothetical protein n=1 Tax=Parelusimicrobium proximum TaxID=3228953 RepID=UPI003D163F74
MRKLIISLLAVTVSAPLWAQTAEININEILRDKINVLEEQNTEEAPIIIKDIFQATLIADIETPYINKRGKEKTNKSQCKILVLSDWAILPARCIDGDWRGDVTFRLSDPVEQPKPKNVVTIIANNNYPLIVEGEMAYLYTKGIFESNIKIAMTQDGGPVLPSMAEKELEPGELCFGAYSVKGVRKADEEGYVRFTQSFNNFYPGTPVCYKGSQAAAGMNMLGFITGESGGVIVSHKILPFSKHTIATDIIGEKNILRVDL